MAKAVKRPKISTYVLTVNNETGKILRTEVEDAATGKRKVVQAYFYHSLEAAVISVPLGKAGTHGKPGGGGVLPKPGLSTNSLPRILPRVPMPDPPGPEQEG